ncbi:MAG: DNA repair protein RecO [Chloroflexota bacterium]
MLKRTEGIVLKATAFGEADLIVTYLSRECGLIKVFAKSPRKTKSRFGSSLEPLTHSRLSFIGKENAHLPRLTQADIVRPFHSLREDLPSFLRMSELLELNLQFLPERDPNPGAFELLLTTMSLLEDVGENPLCRLLYKIRFLEIVGYAPKLDACGRCARPSGGNGVHRFFSLHGALLCEKCVTDEAGCLTISDGALRFYQSFSRWHAQALDRVQVPGQLVSEVNLVISTHIRAVLGRSLRSDTIPADFRVPL